MSLYTGQGGGVNGRAARLGASGGERRAGGTRDLTHRFKHAIALPTKYHRFMVIAPERLHRIATDVYERMAAGGLLPERGVELIDGLVVEISPKGDRHGYAVSELSAQLSDQRGTRYRVYADSLSLRLGPRDEPEPDVALARATRSFASERPRADEIALIVEVAETSLAFDLGEKRVKYAVAGIPEYWVVDLQGRAVHVFREPCDADYRVRLTLQSDANVSPQEFPEVSVNVALVLGDA